MGFGLVAIAWLSQDNSPDSTSPSRSEDNSPVEIGLSSPNSPQQPTSNTRQTVSPAPPRFDVVRSAPPLSRSSPAIDRRTMYVDASRLNVRNGPRKTDKVIWTVKRDEAVSVTKTAGDWSFIRGARYEGWVYSGYLTPNKSPVLTVTLEPKNQQPIRQTQQLSEAAIAQILIDRSKAYYSVNCPCPYNTDRAGRRCGGRSAYSRPGGASPLCYPRDISLQMIADYRARQ